jgi:hypothetical protein
VAAVLGITLEQLRPHLGDFEHKRYTNPTLMYQILRSLGAAWVPIVRTKPDRRQIIAWPRLGLVRIQWEGPWTAPGVPTRARYRRTHWIGASLRGGVGVFDVNCLNNGSGWASLYDWSSVVVPHILECCHPTANGAWHQTHVLELAP